VKWASWTLLWGLGLAAFATQPAAGQFVDAFADSSLAGWTHQTGDGDVSMTVAAEDEGAQMVVDATADRHTIWGALKTRDVLPTIDLTRLQEPGAELRVTARVRSSHAGRCRRSPRVQERAPSPVLRSRLLPAARRGYFRRRSANG
jgi:hypothetical protein